jgi:hypothetical protein
MLSDNIWQMSHCTHADATGWTAGTVLVPLTSGLVDADNSLRPAFTATFGESSVVDLRGVFEPGLCYMYEKGVF